MIIALVPIGESDLAVLEALKQGVSEVFRKNVVISGALPAPGSAFDRKRAQYRAMDLLRLLMRSPELSGFERTLGVFGFDLFDDEMSFVFGLAGLKAAVISLYRLESSDRALYNKRALTEAVHELGHTYGLRHCPDSQCVMFFSNTIQDTDRKGAALCQRCSGLIDR